jgi:hypothetical protein
LRKLSQFAGFLSGSNIPAALCSLALLSPTPAPSAASAAGFILFFEGAGIVQKTAID